MNRDRLLERYDLASERYELWEGGSDPLAILGRRDFLRAVGGGLVVLLLLGRSQAQESGGGGRRRRGEDGPREVGAWIQIGEDGAVTAYTGKVEVGQNARTSLAMAVADELRLPVESVAMVMGDTDRVPFDMGTFGSRTTPTMVPQLRRAAAAARRVLIKLAAEKAGVEADPDAFRVKGGKITYVPKNQTFGFGDLTGGRRLLEMIEDEEAVTPAADWKAAGVSTPKVDGLAFVTGQHQYASDAKRPGMLVAKILRAPTLDAKLQGLDSAEAEAMPGVQVVRDGEFVAVAAPDEPTAIAAIAALEPDWEIPDGSKPDNASMYDGFRAALDQARSEGSDEADAVAKGLKSADARIDVTYEIAYIAHAPLETRAALAEWDGEKLTVTTGTQRPFGVREEVAAALNLPITQVRVLMPDTGAGYGGKHTGEAAVEAARVAHALGKGKPVRLTWTREEEFTWAYLRPSGLIAVKAGAARDGRLTAWEFRNINSGGSGIETPYEVPARLTAHHPADSPLRQGSYRALAATANTFARESAMDELAGELGIDPLAFRLKNLENARLREVLATAAERFGWGEESSTPDRGFGLACAMEKGGHIAGCVEVAIVPGRRGRRAVRLARAVLVFDCGAIVNPDQLRAQVEGATIQGLGGALTEAIRFADGKLQNGRFSRYPMPRFPDVPAIEVILIDREDVPAAGAGESPIVAIAPAVANAIAAATGFRSRSMPLAPDGLPSRDEAVGAGS